MSLKKSSSLLVVVIVLVSGLYPIYKASALELQLGHGQNSIAGEVFNDENGNGQLDTGEGGLVGFQVYLDLNKDGSLDPGDPSIRRIRYNPTAPNDKVNKANSPVAAAADPPPPALTPPEGSLLGNMVLAPRTCGVAFEDGESPPGSLPRVAAPSTLPVPAEPPLEDPPPEEPTPDWPPVPEPPALVPLPLPLPDPDPEPEPDPLPDPEPEPDPLPDTLFPWLR